MKAVIYEKYGGPEVLELREIGKPVPKDNEVLIKVCAVSLNDWDWQLLLGIPFVNRMTNGRSKPKKKILGSDIAGQVEVVGKNVKKFKAGDEVFGDINGQWGGFAEYVCAREDLLVLKPKSLTFEQAASMPQAGMLAVQGLIDIGKIRQGQKILINGAGGGVGTFGVQIAKLFGAEVTGVDSTEKLDMMRSTGFDHVIDYTKEDFTKTGRQYDLIIDAKTSRSVFDHARALNPGGRYVTVGGDTWPLLKTVLLGLLVSIIYKKGMRLAILKPNKDLAYMIELFESGKLKPVIDGHYSLNEVPEAFRYFGQGHHKGKVVVTI